jgi:hypothetical protein
MSLTTTRGLQPDHHPAMPRNRSDRRVSLLWVATFVAYTVVQIGLPAIQLTAPRPSRFGWHMFAGIGDPEVYAVAHSDGSVERINQSVYFGNWRSDLVIAVPVLVGRICAHRSNAIGVRVTNVMTDQTREFPCRRE